MRVQYDYVKIERKVVNHEVELQLEIAKNDMERQDIFIRSANQLVAELEGEKATIEDIGSKFAYFISTNSLFVSKSIPEPFD